MSTTISTFLSATDLAAAISAAELIQLLDDPITPAGTLNTTRRDQLMAQVNGRMESSIGVRYALPLVVEASDATAVAAALLGCGLAIFRWLAVRDKPHADEAFKGIKSGHDDAIAWLDKIAAGKASLGTSKPVPGAEARTGDVQTSTNPKTFTRDRLSGW